MHFFCPQETEHLLNHNCNCIRKRETLILSWNSIENHNTFYYNFHLTLICLKNQLGPKRSNTNNHRIQFQLHQKKIKTDIAFYSRIFSIGNDKQNEQYEEFHIIKAQCIGMQCQFCNISKHSKSSRTSLSKHSCVIEMFRNTSPQLKKIAEKLLNSPASIYHTSWPISYVILLQTVWMQSKTQVWELNGPSQRTCSVQHSPHMSIIIQNKWMLRVHHRSSSMFAILSPEFLSTASVWPECFSHTTSSFLILSQHLVEN